MTRVSGKMLCDEEYLYTPQRLIDLVAQGLHTLWRVETAICPDKVSRLDARLKRARFLVEHNLVDTENVEPETFGPEGFRNPEELLIWLEQNRPEEDLVLSHGDFCLPNILAIDERIGGYIDLGKMGQADRWQDVAIVLRSLKHNAEGFYNEGRAYFDFRPEMLLDRLGIEMDETKLRYYLLLDELF